MDNRKQRVKINSCYSNWASVLSGVPQGSILGPLLFIIYINELPDICNSGSNLFLYADDAKLYKHILNSQDKDVLQNDLIKLKLWADNWLINLNIVKCKKVSYGRLIHNTFHYNLNNIDLDNIESIKDLGVIFDSHLKFKLHISDKVNKAYSILEINFTFLDKDSFIVLYKSMVRSHLEYANCIWYPYTVQDIKTLERFK